MASRRQADRWIAAGRVQVNGQTALLGSWVDEQDVVEFDGARVMRQSPPIFLLYHKPVGVICTHDPKVKNNLPNALKIPHRLFAVGRLDKDSEGLMLLTNQGEIVNRILRVENGHPKRYRVTVDHPLTAEFLQQMAEGVEILNTRTRPTICVALSVEVFELTLTQGLNRQIRRMCQALGYRVLRLERLAILHLELGHLPSGEWRELEAEALSRLYLALDLDLG